MIDTVALLLADRSPALRYRALLEVDGAPADDPEVEALADAVAASPDVDRVVAEMSPVGADVRALSFALCRLAYLGLRRGHPAVDVLADRLFAAQRADGSWPLPSRRGAGVPEAERYQWIPVQTALPLRGLGATGHGDEPRAERGYEWLLARRLDDGSWPTGAVAGTRGRVMGYRRLPRSEGCRANTTAAVAALAHHPERRTSEPTRSAIDLLLQRETRDEWALGYEVARLLGVEPVRGFITFYARFDLALLLDLASRAGMSMEDARVDGLVSFLLERRGAQGLWAHPTHPHLSRWLTLDLLASMRRLREGAWTGTDLRVPFRAYPRRRPRY